jgi:hypothetical protein
MPGIVRLTGKSIFIAFLAISLQSYANNGTKGLPDEKNFPSLFNNTSNSPVLKRVADSIYDLISLGEYGLERDVFFSAYKGYQYLENRGMLSKSNLLTICDYSQSANNKRLYVIDLLNSRLLFNTYVSHGKNSGNEFATSFSNYDNSNKSSLGFMVTADTYHGKAGYCMRFNGMEAGINDRVRSRGIVLHGSHFVNEEVMSERGTIGHSLGCPAVPLGIHARIIDAIKGGSCFFINSPDQWYAHNSRILNASFDLAPSVQLQPATATTADKDNEAVPTANVK